MSRKIRRSSASPCSLAVANTLDALESRRMLATFNGTLGNDIITVDIVGANIVISNLSTGAVSSFSDAAESTIVVNGFGGNDTITVLRNGLNPTTINGGAGNDTINVGNTNFDVNINANVTVNGEGDIDTLIINDTADALGSDTSTITATTFKKVAAETVSWGTGVNLVENIQIDLPNHTDRVNIRGSGTGMSLVVNTAGGADSIVIEDDFDSAFFGAVHVNAGSGTDDLTLDDTADAGNDTYNVWTSGFSTLVSKPTTTGALSFESVATFGILAGRNAGSYSQTFNVLDSQAATTIIADAGDDILNIGDGSTTNLEDLDATITFFGEAGIDRVNINDQNNAQPDSYTIMEGSAFGSTTVAIPGTADLNINDSESIFINGGNQGHTYNLERAVGALTVNAGTGNDSLDASAAGTNDLDASIRGNVVFNGGAGNDSITLNDSLDPAIAADTYTLSGTGFDKPSEPFFGSFAYSGVDRIVFTGNGDGNLLTLGTFAAGQQIVVNTGAGNDTIENDSGNDLNNDLGNALVTLSGGTGTDRIDFDDSFDFQNTSYGVSADLFTSISNFGNHLSVYYDLFEGLYLRLNDIGTDIHLFGVDNEVGEMVIWGEDGNDRFLVGGEAGSDLDSPAGFMTGKNIVLDGMVGQDSLIIRDTDANAGDDRYTVQDNYVQKGQASVTRFDYSNVEAVELYGSNLPNTYNIDSLATPLTLVGGSQGDTFYLALSSRALAMLDFPISLDGAGGSDNVQLFDEFSFNGSSYSVTASSITKPSAIFGGLTYTALESVALTANSLSNTINILSTSAPTTISGYTGNDTFNVGTGNLDATLLGSLTLLAGDGTDDRLIINDTLDTPGNDTLTITNALVTRPGVSIGYDDDFESLRVDGSNQATIYSILSLDEATTINAGNGADQIQVGNAVGSVAFGSDDIKSSLVVNAAGGDDLIRVGNGDLDEISGLVTVHGQADGASVIVQDFNDTGSDTYSLVNGVLTKPGAGGNFVQLSITGSSIALDANNDSNTIISDNAGWTVVLQGNSGADNFNLIEGTATVRGSAGFDTLTVNQSAVGTATAMIDQGDQFDSISIFVGGSVNVLPGDHVLETNTLGTLGGTLDLGSSTVMVRSPSVPFLVDKLYRGYNAGGWNGTPVAPNWGSVVSSTAAASAVMDAVGYAHIGAGADQLNVASVRGVAVNPGNFVMSYTLAGDTDLDRSVGFADLLRLAQNYSPITGGRSWVQGNFTYGDNDTAFGATGFPDLLSLAQNFNTSLASQPQSPMAKRRIFSEMAIA